MKGHSRTIACGLAAALIAGCGGGDDAAPVAGSGGNGGSNGGGTPGTSTPAAVAPLAGGQLYVGAIGFGDTVSVELGQPAAGKLTLRFLDSQFGLAGSLVADYAAAGNGYRAGQFTAGAGAPAALAQAAAAVTFTFTLQDGVLSGALGQVPNVAAGDGSLLQGHLSAANRGAQLADIAGTYNFLRQAGTLAAAGQLRIGSDGAVRYCPGQAYADACSGGESGKLAADADQARYPGAFALSLSGKAVGRLFVARAEGAKAGQATLVVDEASRESNGTARNGSWLLQATQALGTQAIDGDWLCAEPELDSAGATTGRTARNIVSVGGTTLAADNLAADVALRYNAAAGGNANGLIAGSWPLTVDGQARQATLALLPVNARLAYQLRQVEGGTRQLMGVCTPMPAEAGNSAYLGAKANDIIKVTLGDLRPTQPAIGYDQIYYKLGRYAADPVKKFDDACEANGQNKSKSAPLATARLDDLSSFTCTKDVGTKPEDMKTLVVGPGGVPYLTDGHHTFSSVWESADGGSKARMWIKVQDNLSTLSRGAFFRTLRARKLMWLKDADNRAITPVQLPAGLGFGNGLGNDRYRSLVYFTRDIGYQQLAGATEFTEFYWGDWLRRQVKLSGYNLDDNASYLSAVRAAATAMVALAPDAVVSNGKTAAELGRLDAFNETEFTALSQPVGSAKPGKLPYAVSYRLGLH